MHGLVVNFNKCTFGVDAIEILGHHALLVALDHTLGIGPLADCVDAIVRLPKRADKKGLQEFRGMLNFYHPHDANMVRPLHHTLKGD